MDSDGIQDNDTALAVTRTNDLPNPQVLREQAMRRLCDYFARLTTTAPVVLLLEDLHWADHGFLTWIDAAADELRGVPLLVVVTTRPGLLDRRPHWGEGLSHHTRLQLDPLSRRQSRALVSALLDRVQGLPATLTDLVVTSAEGNPFYVEELVSWLRTSGVITGDGQRWAVADDRIESAAVPATLKGLLQARLDSLSIDERGVLQRAAVIGRVFWDDAVEQLDPVMVGGTGAEAWLDRLRTGQIVFERERSSFAETREFVFKHALLRDVAYEGLLRNRRRDYHRRAAAWLKQQSERSQRGDEYAALIAEHLDHAGDPAAARWYLRAGRKARSVHALTEAARLLSRGVRSAQDPAQRFDLLVLHEEVLDRMGDRAGQREALAAMDQAVLDSTAPDGAARAADVGRRITAMLARSRWCFGNSEYEPATRLAAEAAVIASTAQLRSRMAEAHLWTGKAHTWAARPDEARVVLGQALGEGTREGGHRDRRGDAAVPVDSRQQRG